MPRGPEVSRHLYGEAPPPGCMGGMLNMFDWNNAILGGKKLLADLEFPDGLEAPRNSLDTTSGGSGIGETPKSSSATKSDIPFGFKITKPAIPAKEPSRANEKRIRGPSVVARLMGLDALPDAPSAAKLSDQQSVLNAKNHKERLPVAKKLLKDVKLLRPQSNDQARYITPDSKVAGKEVLKNVLQRDDVDPCIANRKDLCDSAPARDEHPQEKQLQEFKKQFASKLAVQSHENRQRRQSESFNREVQDKRVMVEDKMDEPKAAVGRGEKSDPKRLEATLKKLNKSKELQEFLEVLQSNKEFFLKFLQEPNSMLLDKHLQEPVPEEEEIFTPPPPIEVKKSRRDSESKGKSSDKKKRGGISPSAFARRFMESRREGKEQKEKLRSQNGSRSQTETEENTPISTPKTSISLLPRFRGRSKSKSQDIDKSSTTSSKKEQSFSVDSYKVDPYSPGNIVLLRPGSTDSTGINSPVSVLSYSPRLSRSGKESASKGHKATEDLEAKDYQYQHGEMTPRSEKSRLGDWDYASPSEDITRHIREGTRHREKHEKYDREGSKDPKDIARNIIREARASAREVAKFEHSAGEVRLSSSGSASASRRIAQLRMGSDSGDISGSSDGEITPCSTGGLSTSSSRDYHNRPSSGMGSISSAVAAHFSPRAFQDLGNNSQISVDQRPLRRDGEKQQDPRKSVPDTTNRPGSSPRSKTTPSSSQVSSKVLRKAIVGSLLESRILAARDPQQYSGMSSSQLLEKGEILRTTSTASQSEEESVANSPKTLTSSLSLQRCRSVPNAALVRDTRSRGEQAQNSSADGGDISRSLSQLSHEPSVPESVVVSGGKQFADSYKRGVEAVGSLFARAKSKERNKIFVRSRKKLQAPDANEPKTSSVSPTNSQESMVVSCSSSHATCPVSTWEDFPCAEFDVSKASPMMDWTGVLPANDSEPEAGEVKRVAFASNATSSLEREKADLARPCVAEQQLPAETPSMLVPCMQRVRVNADMATDQCSSTADSITTTDIVEVSAGPQLSRSPKIRSIATDTLHHKDEKAQETGVDKSGQPSPISVLDSPFEEDSPSPREFKEISSDLQELRLRLRLLKLDGSDRPRPSLDGTQDSGDMETQVVNRQLIAQEPDNSEESADFQTSCTVRSSKPTTPRAVDVAGQRALLESIDLEGFPYPEDRKEDLVYVRNLLVASEFVESTTKVFTRWHSPSQPLDPILFENLEEYYNHGNCTPPFLLVEGKIKRSGKADMKPRHRILFDAVNEVLLRKLGPYLNFRPWVQPSTPLLLRPIPMGRMLVWDTWMDVCDSFPSCGVDAPSFLLDRDLGSGPEWASTGVREIFEEFGLQLERTIFDDLVDEAVLSLIEVK